MAAISQMRYSDTQIRTAGQKSAVKQEDPAWKFLYANAHFIRTIWWSSFSFRVGSRSHTSIFSTTPLFAPRLVYRRVSLSESKGC